MRIIVELEESLVQEFKVSEFDLKLLIRDAIHDFMMVRQPITSYVSTRYDYFTTEKQKIDKINDVNRRINIAKQLNVMEEI